MHCHLCKTLHLQSETCGEKEHPSCPPASFDLLLDAEGQEQTLKHSLEVRAALTITLSVRPIHLPLLTGMHIVTSLLAYFHETIESA